MSRADGIRRDENGYMSAGGLGDARRSTDRLVRTYAEGRRCTCGARLSVFNEDDVCAPCSGERWADH